MFILSSDAKQDKDIKQTKETDKHDRRQPLDMKHRSNVFYVLPSMVNKPAILNTKKMNKIR